MEIPNLSTKKQRLKHTLTTLALLSGLTALPAIFQSSSGETNAQPPMPPLWSILEDADQDGMTDVDELLWGMDPFNPEDGLSDLDGDEISLAWEFAIGTNSSVADTDMDSWSDAEEYLLYGTDPLDFLSFPLGDAPVGGEGSATESAIPEPEAAPPPPPTLSNGDFSDVGITTWLNMLGSTEYQGKGFVWNAGTVSGWTAYVGSTVEVWEAGGERFVELDGSPGNYGIKQEIAHAKAGGYVLTWRESGRSSTKAGSDPYSVRIYYLNGATEVPIAQSAEFSGLDKMQWADNAVGFQITPEQLAAAKGTPIYVAFIPSGSSLNTYGTLIDKVSLLPVEVVPDYNRDGMISDEDRGKVTEEKPFVFWTNDDDDGNAEPHFGDIPGTQIDGADMLVNGVRDLVDFFPVQLRIQAILAALPADKYTYKISHITGAFHFIEMPNVQPDSSPEAQGAGAYLRNPSMADEAMARPMLDTAGQGAQLTAAYLDAAKDGMGVLLFEAKSATNQSFELIISKKAGGGEVARIPRAMPIEIVDVEKMFWRANIRPAAYGQTPGTVIEPASAKFKATRKERWFVFCHGYNVSEAAARGWNSEVYKRLHQMGSDSKFLGVTWEGNQGRLSASIPLAGGFAPDYWRNVYNAFSSSQALATLVNGLSGGGKVVAGHSLGNMIMGSAICDKGMNAENYFMLNAAVPREAYFPNHIATDRNSVRNPTFQPYPTRLWSSDWKNLFPNSDGRAKLTWQGRFADLATKTTPHNYYSMGEDVVKSGNGTYPNPIIDVAIKGNFAWISQEMNKGLATKAFITGVGTGNWSANGGWEFNPNNYQQYRPNPLDSPGGTLPDTAALTNAQLMANPFFKPFTKLTIQNGGAVPDSANGIDLASSQGSTHAANYAVKAWLLAHDIPAISQPAASNPVNEIAGDDMNGSFKTGNWGNPGNWKHSDLKEQTLDGVWKLFKDMVTRGDLK